TEIEIVVLDWFKEFLGYPAAASGILTGGGSEANLTAMVVAREKVSYAERGQAVVYVSEHRHWSIDRAAKIIGFRPDQVQPVAADGSHRLTDQALADTIERDRKEGKLP